MKTSLLLLLLWPTVSTLQDLTRDVLAPFSPREESKGAYSAADIPISCCTTQQQVILVQSSILYTSHEVSTALWICS